MAERSLLLVLGNSHRRHRPPTSRPWPASAWRQGWSVTVCCPRATDELFDFAATGASLHVLRRATRPAGQPSPTSGPAGSRAAARDRARPRTAAWCRRRPAPNRSEPTGRHLAQRPAVPWTATLAARAARADRRQASRCDGGCLRGPGRTGPRAGAGEARFVPVAPPPLAQPSAGPAELRSLWSGGRAARSCWPSAGCTGRSDLTSWWQRQPAGRPRIPRPVVLIAGDGPERDALQRQASELGVDVRLLGRRTDVADLMAIADVVVLPS